MKSQRANQRYQSGIGQADQKEGEGFPQDELEWANRGDHYLFERADFAFPHNGEGWAKSSCVR